MNFGFAEKAAALTSLVGALVIGLSFFVAASAYRADKESYLFEMQMHRARFVEAHMVLGLAKARQGAGLVAQAAALPKASALGLSRLPEAQEAFAVPCQRLPPAAAVAKKVSVWCIVFRDDKGNVTAAPYVDASDFVSEGMNYVVTPDGRVVLRSGELRAKLGEDVSSREAVKAAFRSQIKENTTKVAANSDMIVSYKEIENTNLIAFSEISTRALMAPFYAALKIWFLIALSLIALGSVATFYLVRRIARPSALATSHLVRIAHGEFAEPPVYERNDEFRVLFEGIHFLARNLQAREVRLTHVRESLQSILLGSSQLPVEASVVQLEEYAHGSLTQILAHAPPSRLHISLPGQQPPSGEVSSSRSLVLTIPQGSPSPEFVAQLDGITEENLWPEIKQTLRAFANTLEDHFERRRVARTLAMGERREAELQLAGLIQASLVRFPKEIPNTNLAWQYLPAGKLGGDWISAYYDETSRLLRFFIADATGHGVVPAMVTAVVAGAARHFSLSSSARQDSSSELETRRLQRFAVELNEIVLEAGAGKVGLSLIMGSLECESGLLTLLQFGHPFPLLFDARSADDGSVSVVKPLGNHGLGATRFPHPQAQDIQLQSGQGLFLYTDGLVENFRGRLTTRRIRKVLASSLNCGDAVDAVVREYAYGSDEASGGEGHDDVAMLALRWGE